MSIWYDIILFKNDNEKLLLASNYFFVTLVLPCTLSNPCIYGTCYDNYLGGYSCTCITGYTGTNCQYGKLLDLFQIIKSRSSGNKNIYKKTLKKLFHVLSLSHVRTMQHVVIITLVDIHVHVLLGTLA